MESNNWKPSSQGEPGPDPPPSDGWQSNLPPDSRTKLITKIFDTLRKHLPTTAPDGIHELKKIAMRFEEKIFTGATSQTDYLRKISMKMLSMEAKTQGSAGTNPSLTNLSAGNQNPADPASLGMQSQVVNQGQSSGIPGRQLIPPPNLQNNINTAHGGQGSVSLSPSLPSVSGVCQSAAASLGQTSNLQNMSGISQSSVNSSSGQGAGPNIYARQLHGRQQQSIISQQQQHQSQSQYAYQHQLQQHLLKPKITHPSLMQSHMQQQQQQQSLLQPNQLHSSQQHMMQMASSVQSSQSTIQQTEPPMMQSTSQSGLQQNQPNAIQRSSATSMHQHPHSVGRQQTHATIHQQSPPVQQAMIHQQSNARQTQLLGQQNSVPDMQQQQQQRLLGQQNNTMNMKHTQQMLNQQTVSIHQQQQLGTQNNISGVQHQQQLLGSQSGALNMQPNQRSGHILQQTKITPQQQTQQPSLTLLQSQGQQFQHQSSQQQLTSQIESQPSQLQQQTLMQQQSKPLQHDMQQRLQASGGSLQSQNAIEKQKQFIQSQRAQSDASSSMVMDTGQIELAGLADLQEEIYQKVKSMKDLYFVELSEYYQKIAQKFQQLEALTPPGKPSEQYERLKHFKVVLERLLRILQICKNEIPPVLKEKLPLYEKQICTFLSSNRKQRIVPSQSHAQQQFQHLGGHAQTRQHDSHVNQVQHMNLQESSASIQSGPASTMQHGSMPSSTHLNVSNIQQSMTNVTQPGNMDPIRGSSFGSMQQSNLGSVQNTITAQHASINSLLQSSANALQPNSSPMQPAANALQQNLKQQQLEQHLMQNQQMKHQWQQRQMQQLVQQSHKQQLPQQQSPMHPQSHQQQKQQQMAQLPVQMPQIHQMRDVNEFKLRQVSGVKPALNQQHYSAGQRINYYQQQVKGGSSFPASSPQNFQTSSPQISQHSSPQIDQSTMLLSLPKAGTPSQSANSPFVVPSPSTPIAPSPLAGDSEKTSATMPLTNASNIVHQQRTPTPSQVQALVVATPGISASPLLAEFTSPAANQANASTETCEGRSDEPEQPIQRLIKMMQSSSSRALSSAFCDIGSVVSLTDKVAGASPGNGSRTAAGEDLVANARCPLHAKSWLPPDESITKKMKRHVISMSLNVLSSDGSVNDSCKQSYGLDASESESTATSSAKRHKAEVSHALLEEINSINQRLIDMEVSISEEHTDTVAAEAGVEEGIIIICSFTAVSLSPDFKSYFASTGNAPVLPLKLLVPSNYPDCSPILLDKLPEEPSKQSEDLSAKALSIFSTSVRCLSQPMLLKDTVKTWDNCVRKVIMDLAQSIGGGSFSSKYGSWENCEMVDHTAPVVMRSL